MKTSLNYLSKCCLTLVVLAALDACDPGPGTTYLLRATFENDILDGHPDKTLPGDPIGDELVYGKGMSMSIRPTNYAPTYKSLDYRHGGPISFVGKPTSFVGTLTFKWAGTVVNHWQGASPLYWGHEEINISDGYGHFIAKFVIEFSSLVVKHKDSDPNDWQSGQALYNDLNAGSINEPRNHIIEVNVNLTQGLFNVKVTNTWGTHTYEDIPIYEQNTSVYSTSPRPTITFNSGDISNESGGYDDGYILDEVFISKSFFVQPL